MPKLRTSVITTVRFEIEHEGELSSNNRDIYNFLAMHTNFLNAFGGATDGEFTVVDADVIDDAIENMNYHAHQPDEENVQ